MKTKSVGFLAAALLSVVLITGCRNDLQYGEEEIQPHFERVTNGLYRTQINQPELPVAVITLPSTGVDKEVRIDLRNPNDLAAGHFSTQAGHTLTFSAIENNGGVHGKCSISGPLYIDVKMNSACIEVVGNKATIAGEVTSIDLGDNPAGIPLEPGWLFYFAVEDNGEGVQADPDRYHGFIYWGMPGFGVFCNILTPDNNAFWPDESWFDAAGQGDQIEVQ